MPDAVGEGCGMEDHRTGESKYVKIADFLVSIPISIKRLGGWTNMFVLVAGNFKECQWWKETVDF